MKFDDSLHECQTNPCSITARVQLIKKTKNVFAKFWGNAYSIVFHIKDRHAVQMTTLTDLDSRRTLISHELGGVIDQILHDLQQTLVIAKYRRKVFSNAHGDIAL